MAELKQSTSLAKRRQAPAAAASAAGASQANVARGEDRQKKDYKNLLALNAGQKECAQRFDLSKLADEVSSEMDSQSEDSASNGAAARIISTTMVRPTVAPIQVYLLVRPKLKNVAMNLKRWRKNLRISWHNLRLKVKLIKLSRDRLLPLLS